MFPLELSSKVIFMAFTPDGAGLVTGEVNGTTRFWPALPRTSIQPGGE
jgi:hypothetical protein